MAKHLRDQTMVWHQAGNENDSIKIICPLMDFLQDVDENYIIMQQNLTYS